MAIRIWKSEEYHSFWQQSHLSYLDRVERRLLRSLIEEGEWFIDIGGGYGRLMDIYKNRYSNCVITDYSMSMLQDSNRYLIRNGINNVCLVAADVHYLPFINGVFDSAMMVRLIHHIENPAPVLHEVHRILKPSGSLIFEFQNKRNMNFRIKARLGLMNRKRIESLDPFEAGPLYWNFHPKAMERLLSDNFRQESILGGGLFWNRKLLTSLLPKLDVLESWFAPFLGRNTLTHQLFLKLQANKDGKDSASGSKLRPALTTILKCLRCGQGTLERRENHLTCTCCDHIYNIQENIYDFRLEGNA